MSDYPAYARSERIADGIIHAVGIVLALVGAVLLMTFAAHRAESGGQVAAVAVYSGALLASLVISACYHMTPWEGLRPTLRRLDHAAIYLKIAGTYTPLVVVIGSAFAYGVLALVWLMALAGAVAKLFLWLGHGRLATGLYLLLGWLSVVLAWPLVQSLPPAATILVVCGGLLYSAGVYFFSWESLKFANAIWHGFVLAASVCFFVAITLSTFA